MTNTFTFPGGLVAKIRHCSPNAEGLGPISGQGTRSHMLQRKIQNLETETQRSLVAQTVKNPPAKKKKRIHLQFRRLGCVPGSGRSPGGGNGSLLQYSCLGNAIDKETWDCKELDMTEQLTHNTARPGAVR